MKIIGVNGILVNKRKNASTDVLLKRMSARGYETHDFNYPFTTAVMAYSKRLRCQYAERLADTAGPGDVVFGHSFGCAVIWQAVQLGAKFKAILLMSAAVDGDLVWPEDCSKIVINAHNPRDWVLAVGHALPFHVFGTLGKCGYSGPPNAKLLDINAADLHKTNSYFYNHSDYFLEDNIGVWEHMLDSLCHTAENNQAISASNGVMGKIKRILRGK